MLIQNFEQQNPAGCTCTLLHLSSGAHVYYIIYTYAVYTMLCAFMCVVDVKALIDVISSEFSRILAAVAAAAAAAAVVTGRTACCLIVSCPKVIRPSGNRSLSPSGHLLGHSATRGTKGRVP